MSEMQLSNFDFYAFVHGIYDNQIFFTPGFFFGGCKFAENNGQWLSCYCPVCHICPLHTRLQLWPVIWKTAVSLCIRNIMFCRQWFLHSTILTWLSNSYGNLSALLLFDKLKDAKWMDPKMVDIKSMSERLAVSVENIQPRRQYFPQVPKLSAKHPFPPQCNSPFRASEPQNFMLSQGPQGNATQAKVGGWAALFLCEEYSLLERVWLNKIGQNSD